MANTKKTGTAGAGEAAALPNAEPAPQFQAFRWMNPIRPGESLPLHPLLADVETTRNLIGGVSVILGMFEREAIDRGFQEEDGSPVAPMFSEPDRAELLRMCIGICGVLQGRADETIEWANKKRGAHR
ncbi:hypothetical protein [Sphaerotilus microaerophilus]|uniref:Tail assembly chaperone n=1 Tax=Sphaerotilus microaerophilus TaxID=2914710 RepID=A0ABN6PPN0_9BURK|nr:hypothetical protein [Sphaerotilus sp. FB-5]BDI07134.1 hypothetical protein CATMQ487_41040 [Sphaerotilus sp. FB-5]